LQLSAIETKGQANLNAGEKKWQALTVGGARLPL